MKIFLNLVYNEIEKMYRKKRLYVIIGILFILIPIFVYAQYREYEATVERLGTNDWRVALQQEIIDGQNRLQNTSIPDEWKQFLKINIERSQYYLDNNINPSEPGGVTFVRGFMENGMSLFLPLLIIIFSIDVISGERSDGTIKLLLTRPVKRSLIYLSKFAAIVLFSSMTVLVYGIMSYVLSSLAFGFGGWNMPVLTGFSVAGDSLDTSTVSLIPQWQYLLMLFGFAWFISVIIGTLSLCVSVFVRNTPAGMGIMIAGLIAGSILSGFATNWEGAKYIFSVNLNLADYLAGRLPSLPGLTLSFSITTLLAWGVISFIVSYLVFLRQDMIN